MILSGCSHEFFSEVKDKTSLSSFVSVFVVPINISAHIGEVLTRPDVGNGEANPEFMAQLIKEQEEMNRRIGAEDGHLPIQNKIIQGRISSFTRK